MGTRPPLINQRTLADRQANNDCGEAAAAIILQAHGIMDTPLEEIQDLGHGGVTTVPELVGLLVASGATVTQVAAATLQADLANPATIALVLISDNSNGDPATGPGTGGHFIVGYAAAPGGVACVNPWGGRDVTYPSRQLLPAIVWAGIVTWPAASVPAVASPSPPPLEEDLMDPVLFYIGDAAFISTGQNTWVRHIPDPTTLAGYLFAYAKLTGRKVTVWDQPGSPAGGAAVWGTAVNADTAKQLATAFP